MPTKDNFLSEQEVRECLDCASIEAVEDAYNFGQKLATEATERVRGAEQKATFFAAYGTGIVTLLASTFSTWANAGNHYTVWIAVCASICAFLCTYFAVRVLQLRQGEFISEHEWLNKKCVDNIERLKKYRVLTLWQAIDSRFKGQQGKAKELRCAESSLAFSGLFLVYLLVNLAVLQLFGQSIERFHRAEFWKWFLVGDILPLLLIGGTFFGFFVSLRRIRLS